MKVKLAVRDRDRRAPDRKRGAAAAGRRQSAVSRRSLVAAVLFSARRVRLAQGGEPPAPPKTSQQEADYQPGPKNGVRCAVCTFFRPPASCAVVQGVISPQGWCKFFDLPD